MARLPGGRRRPASPRRRRELNPPLVLVAAVGRNGAIGRAGGLPWRMPGDLRHFRSATWGRPLIVGRRTMEGIGRALPGRFMVAVSGDPAYRPPAGVALAANPEAALDEGQDLARRHGAPEIVVGGGAALYAALIDRADRLLLSEIDLAPAADTFFPPIEAARWRLEGREPGPAAAGDEAAYALAVWSRI